MRAQGEKGNPELGLRKGIGRHPKFTY